MLICDHWLHFVFITIIIRQRKKGIFSNIFLSVPDDCRYKDGMKLQVVNKCPCY